MPESMPALVLMLSLVILVLPGTLYLLLLSLAGLHTVTLPVGLVPAPGRLAIIVPAHNEAAHIARTVDNLLAICRQDGDAIVCVIADNCSDATAEISRAQGARVLERHNLEQRGKGYALDFAFNTLANEGFLGYLVIDADTLAETNLLSVIRAHFAAGAQVVQTRYTVLNAGESARTRLAELALCAFNCLRPRGRHVLGWSAGVLGNGFALRREVLARVPYSATSVVEDLEYHLRLIEADIRVHFADETVVRGDMPVAGAGQKTQRARWEGGRLRMLLDHAPLLLRRVLSGQLRFFEPLLDLLLLPIAYHSLLLLCLLLLPFPLASMIALSGFAIVALHVLIAARVGGLSWGQLAVIFTYLPKYLLWKLSMLRSIVSASKTSTRWVRTDRDSSS
ncbi:glycosyltransferase family 2 protein [Propionivibrio sp.]|uniref:glycosyltransferase family 2 protein n=1 Tax=Propionivibrio sp. TaxID=2212460 RepID=UPI003BEF57B9